MIELREFKELDNLLSDQKIAFGRARDLFEEYAAVCNLETQILRDQPAGTALSEESTDDSHLPALEGSNFSLLD